MQKFFFKSLNGRGSTFWFYMFIDLKKQNNDYIKKRLKEFDNDDDLIIEYL